MRHVVRVVIAIAVIVSTGAASRTVRASVTHGQVLWVAQHSPTGRDLLDISCASASECFAVGVHATIIKTENGGRTWTRVDTHYGDSHPSASFTSVRCPAIGECSVLAPPAVVLHTVNGGRTWQSHFFVLRYFTYLAGVTHLACPTRQVCYATASPIGAGTDWYSHSGSVLKTTDGNRTWKALGIPLSVPCQGSCTSPQVPGLNYEGVGYDLQWISCQSAQSCRAGGDTFIGSHQGFSSAVISTDNGGRTWTLVHSAFDANIGTCPTTRVCTGMFYEPTSPDHGENLLRSADAGLDWTSKDISGPLTSIGCAGPRFCELAGPHGALAMAIGARLFVQRSPTRRDLAAVDCPRPDACYAVGAGGTVLARRR